MDDKLRQLYRQHSESGRSALSPEAKARVKDKVFQQIAQPASLEQTQPVSFWDKLRGTFVLRSYVIVPMALLLIIVSSAAASASSVPGDFLYPLKRQVESARIWIAPSPEAKMNLEVNFAEQRLQEFKDLENGTAPAVSNRPEANEGVNASVNLNTNADAKRNGDNNASAQGAAHQRRERAKKEASDAVDFLKQVQNQYQKDNDKEKADDINKKIDDYNKVINDNGKLNSQTKVNSNSGSGANSGASINLNANSSVQVTLPSVQISLPHGL